MFLGGMQFAMAATVFVAIVDRRLRARWPYGELVAVDASAESTKNWASSGKECQESLRI